MKLNINDTFNKELPIDPIRENYVRIVKNACMSLVSPTPCSKPEVIHFSSEMLDELGISEDDAKKDDFRDIFSGNKIYDNTQPYAMCYGGHQFGSWAGQLGDGRAINLFEIRHNHKQWAVQLKGAGKTPYSRTADGLAVLRSSVREYLCSEAMYHLGVPTTRALSLISTGDEVLRDILYNGHSAYEKGAIVVRVSPSFIRFGNFQIFASRQDTGNLKKLTDYTMRHFFSHLGEPSADTYLEFLKEVALKTIDMVIGWERVGFVHGVMNTDNMSILGLTIDYGPYGWLEDYHSGWTPNTTDAGQARYAYGNQGYIALWNIYQLANALVPDLERVEPLLLSLGNEYNTKRRNMMLQKLGLNIETADAENFIHRTEELLQSSEMDMTIFFRNLSSFNVNEQDSILQKLALYSYSHEFQRYEPVWEKWLKDYATLITKFGIEHRSQAMNAVNPKYVLRNYMAQVAIDAADQGDFTVIDELYRLLKTPYDENPSMEHWFAKRPEWAKNRVGCSQLSCSS